MRLPAPWCFGSAAVNNAFKKDDWNGILIRLPIGFLAFISCSISSLLFLFLFERDEKTGVGLASLNFIFTCAAAVYGIIYYVKYTLVGSVAMLATWLVVAAIVKKVRGCLLSLSPST